MGVTGEVKSTPRSRSRFYKCQYLKEFSMAREEDGQELIAPLNVSWNKMMNWETNSVFSQVPHHMLEKAIACFPKSGL